MASLPNMPADPRPKRFALQLPVEVRASGSEHWWKATTEDISANGLRFRTSNYVPPHTPVDVRLKLPAALTGEGAVQLECSGYVVRSTEPSLACNDARVAVTLIDFHVAGNRDTTAELRRAEHHAAMCEIATLIHRLNGALFVVMGNLELIASNQQLERSVRETGTRALTATEDTSNIVRKLADMLKLLS